MPTLRYVLPDGCANTPVTAADGSIWVNHFSGLFRCHRGEVFSILPYQDGGITWVYSAPLNKHYSHGTAHLPSPVVFGDRVYVSCMDDPGEASDVRRKTSYILCYSSGGTLLWKLTVNGVCTHLISTAAGVFALCGSTLSRVGDAVLEGAVTLFSSGEIIGHHVVEDRCIFIVHVGEQVRLMQVSGTLELTADYLLDEGNYEFLLLCMHPLLTPNRRNLFVFFRANRKPFSGLDVYCFRFAPDGELIFEGKSSYGVTEPYVSSMQNAAFATENGFIYTDWFYTGTSDCCRLLQVNTESGAVSVTELEDKVRGWGESPPPLVMGDHVFIPCRDANDKPGIGHFHAGSFQVKRSATYYSLFAHENRLWISRWGKGAWYLEQMPNWTKESL